MNALIETKLSISILTLFILPALVYAQHSHINKVDVRHAYAAKFFCGDSSEAFQEGFVKGSYQTTILVNNFTSQPVRFKKSISRAFPLGLPGETVSIEEASLPPGSSLHIECNEIRQLLDLSMTKQMREGFVQIRSDGELKVKATYTGRSNTGNVVAADAELIQGRALQCPVGFSGPRCAFKCVSDPDCEIESYHDRQGNVISMVGRKTSLFSVAQSDSASSTLDEFKSWIADNANGFGFLTDIVPDNLEIETMPAMESVTAGGFNVHRYLQKYRGLPVIGSDRIISVTSTPGGVLSFSGTLINPLEEIYRVFK